MHAATRMCTRLHQRHVALAGAPAAPRIRPVVPAVQAADDVAIPYAAGILDLAQERNILDNVYNDLMGLQVRARRLPTARGTQH